MQPTDECINLDGWFCQLEVEDAITVPGKLCEDAGTHPSEVTCKDAWSYLDLDEEEPAPEPEPQPEDPQATWMDGPLYWVAVISMVGLLAASISMINNNLRSRSDDGEE
jgi:hypothetical protein